MELQQFLVGGRVHAEGSEQLQQALAALHGNPMERPRCLCVPGGVEMYVAHHHQRYLVKRMPDTGRAHHPACPSFEPEPHLSGLGELVGEAVLEQDGGRVELRVDFPWARTPGKSGERGPAEDPGEVSAPRRRMTLRAVLHYLVERAGLNRWSPAMTGKRNQGVLHKYLTQAAEGLDVKGVPLSTRLYVPEPFSEATHADSARRRHAKLAVLQPLDDGRRPLALVIGEYKTTEPTYSGHRVWLRHMPDAPLLVATKTWERIAKVHAALLEARDADTGVPPRLLMIALIRARRERTYEIDAAHLMLTSEHWIPLEGVHELPLVRALVGANRRFVKPLRFDAKHAAQFPNALLLDAGMRAVPLHVVSPFMTQKELGEKARAIEELEPPGWVWHQGAAMPDLPEVVVSVRGPA